MIPHPGESLRQRLAERGLSQIDLAFILSLPVSHLNAILTGKMGISASMSKALGLALNLPEDHFAKLQSEYELAGANEPDAAVRLRAALLENYPVREMIRRGWIKGDDKSDLLPELLQFFDLSGTDDLPYLSHAAKKTSYELREIPPVQLAWLFRVRQIARSMAVPLYSPRSLADTIKRMRGLLTLPEDTRHIPRLLAECGVRLVFVESLRGGKIDGVCFWLDDHSPVIGLSARFDRIDNLWFVLRHEIEHVLQRHGLDAEIVDADLEGVRMQDALPHEEQIANAAATDFCVPNDKMESFIIRKRPFYYEKDVIAFASLNHVHPGIVVGQLQHRLNRYGYLTKYQAKIRQHVLPGAIADGWGQSVPI